MAGVASFEAKDVKIKDKKVAIKGSKSKHVCNFPAQYSFRKSLMEKVKSKKVKVNGEEVATIGSTVSTYNDMGIKDNSTIFYVR